MNNSVRSMKTLFVLLIASLAAGCSTATMYDFISANTDPDCSQISNADERSRCKKEANVSYEKYERERQKARGN